MKVSLTSTRVNANRHRSLLEEASLARRRVACEANGGIIELDRLGEWTIA